jgi:hypothetical protein
LTPFLSLLYFCFLWHSLQILHKIILKNLFSHSSLVFNQERVVDKVESPKAIESPKASPKGTPKSRRSKSTRSLRSDSGLRSDSTLNTTPRYGRSQSLTPRRAPKAPPLIGENPEWLIETPSTLYCNPEREEVNVLPFFSSFVFFFFECFLISIIMFIVAFLFSLSFVCS